MSQIIDDVMLASSLAAFASLSLSEVEARLLSCFPPERQRKPIALVLSRDDSDQTLVYAIKIRGNRTVELMAPTPEKAGTAGGRLFGHDRLLTVSRSSSKLSRSVLLFLYCRSPSAACMSFAKAHSDSNRSDCASVTRTRNLCLQTGQIVLRLSSRSHSHFSDYPIIQPNLQS